MRTIISATVLASSFFGFSSITPAQAQDANPIEIITYHLLVQDVILPRVDARHPYFPGEYRIVVFHPNVEERCPAVMPIALSGEVGERYFYTTTMLGLDQDDSRYETDLELPLSPDGWPIGVYRRADDGWYREDDCQTLTGISGTYQPIVTPLEREAVVTFAIDSPQMPPATLKVVIAEPALVQSVELPTPQAVNSSGKFWNHSYLGVAGQLPNWQAGLLQVSPLNGAPPGWPIAVTLEVFGGAQQLQDNWLPQWGGRLLLGKDGKRLGFRGGGAYGQDTFLANCTVTGDTVRCDQGDLTLAFKGSWFGPSGDLTLRLTKHLVFAVGGVFQLFPLGDSQVTLESSQGGHQSFPVDFHGDNGLLYGWKVYPGLRLER